LVYATKYLRNLQYQLTNLNYRKFGEAKLIVFNIGFQQYFKMGKIMEVFNLVETSPYPVDGLIFMPLDDKYVMGYSPNVMKWKSTFESTLDFQVEVINQDPPRSYLLVQTLNRKKKVFYKSYSEKFISKDNQIVECYWDSLSYSLDITNNDVCQGCWVYKRDRPDKQFPNSDWVADELKQHLNNRFDQVELCDYVLSLDTLLEPDEKDNELIDKMIKQPCEWKGGRRYRKKGRIRNNTNKKHGSISVDKNDLSTNKLIKMLNSMLPVVPEPVPGVDDGPVVSEVVEVGEEYGEGVGHVPKIGDVEEVEECNMEDNDDCFGHVK